MDLNGNYVKMDKLSLEEKVKQQHDLLTNEGKMCPGIFPGCSAQNIPEWYDAKKFQHAQKLYSVFAPIISLCSTFGLYYGMHHYQAYVPLLTTGTHRNTSTLFCRYLSTFFHVHTWYQDDPFDLSSKSHKSLKLVRNLHQQAGAKLNALQNKKPGKEELWISQHMMVHTQFAFIGFMPVFKDKIGFQHFSSYDIHCMFHFWRVIGYVLGIENQFNLCSGSDAEITELCRRIYTQDWLPLMQSKTETLQPRIVSKMALGMEIINDLANYNALLRFGAEVFDLDPSGYPLETLREKLIYHFLKFVMNYGVGSKVFMWCFTKISEKIVKIKTTFGIFKWWTKIFERDYEKNEFQPDKRCPVEIKINYKSVWDLGIY